MSRWLPPRVALVALLALHAGCRPAAPAAPAARDALVVAVAGNARSLDPAALRGSEAFEIAAQLVEPLVGYDERAHRPRPALATRWEVSPDGLTYTFELRRGVVFHDGTPCDAQAVVFSLLRHKEHGRVQLGRVRALDRFRVELVLPAPMAPLLTQLAAPSMGIVSPSAVRRRGAAFGEHPVGTGPFRVVEWRKGDRLSLRRFERYWGEKPSLRNLAFQAIPETRARLAALRGGLVDVVYQVSQHELRYAHLHPRLRIHRSPGANVFYLVMNQRRPPFERHRVRLAVAHALDKGALARVVYDGYASRATTPVPRSSWGHHRDLVDRRFDPARARALLAEEARQAGLVLPVRTDLHVADVGASRQELWTAVLAQLRAVGIHARLVVTPLGRQFGPLARGEHGLALTGWSDTADPDNFLYTLLDSDSAPPGRVLNFAFYRSTELHGVLLAARRVLDQKQRIALYRRAQEIVHRDVPWVPIAHWDEVVVARSDVAGLRVNPAVPVSYRRVFRRR